MVRKYSSLPPASQQPLIAPEEPPRLSRSMLADTEADGSTPVTPAMISKKNITSKEETEKIDKLASLHQPRILYQVRTVFPFDFFPDTISIEETRVNVINRQFFFSSHITAISIKDIFEISVNTSIFFASIKLIARNIVSGIQETQIEVPFLKKAEALKARRIIEGLRLLHQEKIDTNKLDLQKLLNKIEEVGRIRTPTVV